MEKLKFLVFFVTAVLIAPLTAETVIYKNGKILKGKVVGQNQNSVRVRQQNGKVATISKNSIFKIVFRDMDQEQAARLKAEEEAKEKEKLRKEAELRAAALKKKSDTQAAQKKVEELEKEKLREQARLERENREKRYRRNLLGASYFEGRGEGVPALSGFYQSNVESLNIIFSAFSGGADIQYIPFPDAYSINSRGFGLDYKYNRYFARLDYTDFDSKYGNPSVYFRDTYETDSVTGTTTHKIGQGAGVEEDVSFSQKNRRVVLGYHNYRSDSVDAGFFLGLESFRTSMGNGEYSVSAETDISNGITNNHNNYLALTHDMKLGGGSVGMDLTWRFLPGWTMDSVITVSSLKGSYNFVRSDYSFYNDTALGQFVLGNAFGIHNSMLIERKGGDIRLGVSRTVYQNVSVFVQLYAAKYNHTITEYELFLPVSYYESNPGTGGGGVPPEVFILPEFLKDMISTVETEKSVRLGVKAVFDFGKN